MSASLYSRAVSIRMSTYEHINSAAEFAQQEW